MVQMEVAEAGICPLLVPTVSNSKTGLYISHSLNNYIFLLDTSCLVNNHVFQPAYSYFVTQT